MPSHGEEPQRCPRRRYTAFFQVVKTRPISDKELDRRLDELVGIGEERTT